AELELQGQKLDKLRHELEHRQAEVTVRSAQVDDSVRQQIEAETRAKMRAEFESGELSVLNGEIERLAKILEDATNERDQLTVRLQELQSAPRADNELARLQAEVATL